MSRALPIVEAVDAPPFEIPAPVQAYVDAIGIDATAEVLLAFGGARLYLATDPKSRSPLAELIGRDKAIALARALGSGAHIQVPTGKAFLARLWKSEGWTVVAIARKLHAYDGTVRRWLRPAGESRQLPLF